ncbi:MAG: hypothetical protein H6571_04075 [Lewinellaceae bacterium]|nr:hypothetical protein [Lewinellaceae bacterium]
MKTEYHNNNVYALNEKGEPKHVSLVERGRKGYYCIGCQAEMEARKGDKRAYYFAHVPTDVSIVRQCTYSDETYRHKLAKEILQRIKTIKVPALYKFPPAGVEGRPRKIRDSWTIEADQVKIERQFYENESGEICFGQNVDFESEKEKFLLIQPDVSFYDKEGTPILLIEIVATHKIDSEKLSKIKRLGIDTIQVTIPKDSPEEIENCFFRTHRTKWVYNYEQETTAYLQIPQGNQEGILPTDEFQRRLLKAAESYSCRSSQINNLIRGIRKCLDSEQFRFSKQYIGGETQRIENNTERSRKRLYKLQGDHYRAVEKRFKPEEDEFKREVERLEDSERKFRKRVAELGQRYHRKREAIETTQENYQPECQSEIERIEKYLAELGEDPTSFDERIRNIRREEERIKQDFDRNKEAIQSASEATRIETIDIDQKTNQLPEEYRILENEIREEFDPKIRGIEIEYQNLEEQTRREFESLGGQIVEAAENRNSEGSSRMHRRIKEVLEGGEILLSIREGQSRIKTLESIKEFYRSGAYKDWV